MHEKVYEKYRNAYGNNTQGCCLLIADEIQQLIGGEGVTGEITWYGGVSGRTHWWVEKDGVVIDPYGRLYPQLRKSSRPHLVAFPAPPYTEGHFDQTHRLHALGLLAHLAI